MEKNNDGANLMVRRRALQVIGVGLTAAGGLLVLQGCTKGGGQGGAGQGGSGGGAAAGGSCSEKIEVDEEARNLRKTLQYKEKSDNPDKKCSVCAQFESARYAGTGCGGCKLFAGAVNPEGACLSFAPKVAPGAPAGAPAAPAAVPAAPAKAG